MKHKHSWHVKTSAQVKMENKHTTTSIGGQREMNMFYPKAGMLRLSPNRLGQGVWPRNALFLLKWWVGWVKQKLRERSEQVPPTRHSAKQREAKIHTEQVECNKARCCFRFLCKGKGNTSKPKKPWKGHHKKQRSLFGRVCKRKSQTMFAWGSQSVNAKREGKTQESKRRSVQWSVCTKLRIRSKRKHAWFVCVR